MIEILDVPAYRERMKRWTVEEFEKLAEVPGWPKRMELIRGVLIESMPKSPLHCALAEWLYGQVQAQLPPGYCVLFERPLRLGDSEPEPDLMVVTGHKEDFDTKHAVTARLVIEIAISTLALDRQNAALYAEAGIEEYWIVLGREKRVEIYRRPMDGAYAETLICGPAEGVVATDSPAIQIALSDLPGSVASK